MMVKSARTKKFDDEIDLIFVNRRLGYIQVDSIIYMLILKVSSTPNDVFYLTNNENLMEI